jgi:LacI family transcriptional regulator
MHTIGVVAVTDGGTLNHYFLEVLSGMLATAGRLEQNVTVFAVHNWANDAARLPSFCDGRIDGLILVAPTVAKSAAKFLPPHTPFVALHANVSLPHVLNIESDEEHGAYAMTRHLLSKGHRSVLHITGTRGFTGSERRIRGFKAALAAGGVNWSESFLLPGDFTIEGGRNAMRRWLEQHAGTPLPDAVFCANDGTAIGCMEALADLGIRVPEDVSVAGFDDTIAARMAVPQLSTVRQPLAAMGSRAVELIYERIERAAAERTGEMPEPVVFPVELVQRASVARREAPPRAVPARS